MRLGNGEDSAKRSPKAEHFAPLLAGGMLLVSGTEKRLRRSVVDPIVAQADAALLLAMPRRQAGRREPTTRSTWVNFAHLFWSSVPLSDAQLPVIAEPQCHGPHQAVSHLARSARLLAASRLGFPAGCNLSPFRAVETTAEGLDMHLVMRGRLLRFLAGTSTGIGGARAAEGEEGEDGHSRIQAGGDNPIRSP